jgi:hypothetical protein
VSLLAAAALVGAGILFRGPGPTPLPPEKEGFVGVWENGAGFRIEITADGRAKVSRSGEAKVEDWNSPVGRNGSASFQANFRGDERLELDGGWFGVSKVYRIRRYPHREGNLNKMTLDGGGPAKSGSSVVLTKKAG